MIEIKLKESDFRNKDKIALISLGSKGPDGRQYKTTKIVSKKEAVGSGYKIWIEDLGGGYKVEALRPSP